MTINKICIIIYAIINLVVFVIYGIDKRKAEKSEWRIPEKDLLLAAVFGAPGALIAMYFFRHKIRKPKFFIGVPAILIAEILIIYFFITKISI